MHSPYTLAFDSSAEAGTSRLGGRCAALIVMTRAGAPVPPGLVVTMDAFEALLDRGGLRRAVDAALAGLVADPGAVAARGAEIRCMVIDQPVPSPVASAVTAAYEELCRAVGCPDVVPAPDGHGLARRVVEEGRQQVPCLAQGEVVEIARLAKTAERQYGCPQDIEWAFDKHPNGSTDTGATVSLLQTRPETVRSRRPRTPARAATARASRASLTPSFALGGSRYAPSARPPPKDSSTPSRHRPHESPVRSTSR